MSLLILERNCFSMPFAQRRYLNFPRMNQDFHQEIMVWNNVDEMTAY